MKILFVCHGNICRSPMAEFIMKDMAARYLPEADIQVDSAAVSAEELGNDMHHSAKAKLRREGIPFSKRQARQITEADYRHYDHIIVMDRLNLTYLKRIISSDPKGKVRMLLDFTDRKGQDIADPWYTGDFDRTYENIVYGCRGLIDEIRK